MQQMKRGRLLCIMLHVQVSYISLQKGKLVSFTLKNFPYSVLDPDVIQLMSIRIYTFPFCLAIIEKFIWMLVEC